MKSFFGVYRLFWGPLSLSLKVVEMESYTNFSVYLLRVRHGLAYGPVSGLEYKYWCTLYTKNTNTKISNTKLHNIKYL